VSLTIAAVPKRVPKRVIVVAMCFVAMVICYLDRVSMSTAVVPMAEQYGWSNTTKGWVLSSFFIGYMLTQIPASWVVNRYGGRIVLGISLLWWSLVTMLTPLAAMSSLGVLIVARIAMGLGEAAVTPSLYNLAARWLPPHELSRSIAVMIGGIPMGTLAALLMSGWLLEHHAWPIMFYVFGAIGLVFALFWFWLIRASPARHPHMSASERTLLTGPDVISSEPRKGSWSEVPWRKLLTTPAVWALISNHFCSNWGLYVLLTWLPSYFKAFKETGIAAAGWYSAAPWLILFIIANLSGVIADRMVKSGMTITRVRKTMQVIGLLGSALGLIVASYVETPFVAVIVLCGALGVLGFTWAGFGPNHLDIAPRYADVLAGLTNTAGNLPGVIGVVVTGWIVDLTGGFSAAFQLTALINIIGALIWLRWSTGEKVID
jgi:ACS family sodium-dependent inorganic phosphate cotransporter